MRRLLASAGVLCNNAHCLKEVRASPRGASALLLRSQVGDFMVQACSCLTVHLIAQLLLAVQLATVGAGLLLPELSRQWQRSRGLMRAHVLQAAGGLLAVQVLLLATMSRIQ